MPGVKRRMKNFPILMIYGIGSRKSASDLRSMEHSPDSDNSLQCKCKNKRCRNCKASGLGIFYRISVVFPPLQPVVTTICKYTRNNFRPGNIPGSKRTTLCMDSVQNMYTHRMLKYKLKIDNCPA